MLHHFRCPGCGVPLTCRTSTLGRMYRCPECRLEFSLPEDPADIEATMRQHRRDIESKRRRRAVVGAIFAALMMLGLLMQCAGVGKKGGTATGTTTTKLGK